MVETNQNIIGEMYIRNDDSKLTLNDGDKKITWKSYHKKLLNSEYICDKDSFSEEHTASDVCDALRDLEPLVQFNKR